MKTTVTLAGESAPRKRKGSLAAKTKHQDWIFTWLVRTQPCAICNGSLAEGFNPRYPGRSVTLHHSMGSREVDDWDNLQYVAGMVLCHSSCHRSYHFKRRHAESGKNVNLVELASMEANIAAAVQRQRQLVSGMMP